MGGAGYVATTHTHTGVHTHHIHTQTDTQREELGFILKALAAINF